MTWKQEKLGWEKKIWVKIKIYALFCKGPLQFQASFWNLGI